MISLTVMYIGSKGPSFEALELSHYFLLTDAVVKCQRFSPPPLNI